MNETEQNREERTYNVRQRTFAVTNKENRLSVLRTGYLGPCVAFYGIHTEKGVAFMSHVDGNLRGIDDLAARLKEETNGDLAGFSLYLSTNYTLLARFFVLAAILLYFTAVAIVRGVDSLLGYFGWAAVLLACWWYCFRSVFAINRYAHKTFRKWWVKPNNPWQIMGRVEVSVDSTSRGEPDRARKETLWLAQSVGRYGPPPDWFSGQRDATTDRENEEQVALRDEQLHDVAVSLAAFQHEYPPHQEQQRRVFREDLSMSCGLGFGQGTRASLRHRFGYPNLCALKRSGAGQYSFLYA
ncbi:hypothetical protein [Paraburkholderia sp. BR10882]|uniref:hypothetical protein n=1 Tax=unclassified Paraburkholderia TaxID=2615204 RepID=UPI0034CDC7F5